MSVQMSTRKYEAGYEPTETTPLKESKTIVNDQESGNFDEEINDKNKSAVGNKFLLTFVVASVVLFLISAVVLSRSNDVLTAPIVKSAWSAKSQPFSTIDPVELGIQEVNRPEGSKPGEILANLIDNNVFTGAPETPLPTNTWYQNLLLGHAPNNLPENKIFQIPYIIDTAGFIPGIRTHPCHLQANDRMVLVSKQVDR